MLQLAQRQVLFRLVLLQVLPQVRAQVVLLRLLVLALQLLQLLVLTQLLLALQVRELLRRRLLPSLVPVVRGPCLCSLLLVRNATLITTHRCASRSTRALR